MPQESREKKCIKIITLKKVTRTSQVFLTSKVYSIIQDSCSQIRLPMYVGKVYVKHQVQEILLIHDIIYIILKHKIPCEEASNTGQVIPKLQDRKLGNWNLSDSRPVKSTLT